MMFLAKFSAIGATQPSDKTTENGQTDLHKRVDTSANQNRSERTVPSSFLSAGVQVEIFAQSDEDIPLIRDINCQHLIVTFSHALTTLHIKEFCTYSHQNNRQH
jgi:hypothetical protein